MFNKTTYVIFFSIIFFFNASAQSLIAYEDHAAIKDDETHLIDVLKNDLYDEEVTIKIISYTNHADPEFNPKIEGNKIKVKYDDSGTNTILYEICSSTNPSNCSQAYLYLTIADNEKIFAANDVYHILVTGEHLLKVLKNDYHEKGVSIQIVTPPVFGQVNNISANIKYELSHLNFQKDSLRYKITDTDNHTDMAWVYIYNPYYNQPPDLHNSAIELFTNTTYTFTPKDLTENFHDDDGNILVKLKITELPAQGILKLNGSNLAANQRILYDEIASLQYIPYKDFTGQDYIKWNGSDGQAYAASPAKISIKVIPDNQAPLLTDLQLTLDEDQLLIFDFSEFKNKFSDPDGDELQQIKIMTLPSDGSLSLNDSEVLPNTLLSPQQLAELKYKPVKNYHGTDQFSWNASDGKLFSENPAKVHLNITAENDPPIAVNDSFSIDQGQTALFDVLLNDRDPDFDQLSLTASNIDPDYGLLTLINNQLNFSPEPELNGIITFSYTVSDGEASETATVQVTIRPATKAPVLEKFTVEMWEDLPFNFTAPMFEQHYHDADTHLLKALSFILLPQHGALTFQNEKIKKHQQLPLDEVNHLVYRPEPDYFGPDSVRLVVYDEFDASLPSTVTFNIQPVNDPPLALNDSGWVINEDESVIVDVLANDFDLESTFLKVISVTGQQVKGQILSDQRINITPAANSCGNFSLTYRIEDEAQAEAEAQVFLQVNCIDDPSMISDIEVQLKEDEEYFFKADQFTNAVSDPEADALEKIIILSLPDGVILYLADQILQTGDQLHLQELNDLRLETIENWNGTTSFTWQAYTNGIVSANQARVNITILPVRDEIIVYQGISPNNDEFNQKWIIEHIEEYPDNQVRIFNRHNILIYQQKEYNNEQNVWQGQTNVYHFNDQHTAPDDIYFYVIYLDESQVYKGHITLKR